MKAYQVKWHSDAGHEWLEVSLDNFQGAKLDLDDINGFSYWRLNHDNNTITLFLEGDLDAAIFLKAWEKAGHALDDIGECDYHSGYCFIRELPRTNTGRNSPRYDLAGLDKNFTSRHFQFINQDPSPN